MHAESKAQEAPLELLAEFPFAVLHGPDIDPISETTELAGL